MIKSNELYNEISYNNKITVAEAIKNGKQIDAGTLMLARRWKVCYVEAKLRLESKRWL